MMIQESMRLKVLILPLSLAIAVIVAIFFIKPAFSDMLSSKNALAGKQAQLENLKNQNQKLQAMKTKWEAMADEKNLVATAFPETENVDSYISEITSKASRSGVLLTDIKLGQAAGVGTSQNPDYICSSDSTGASTAASAQPVGAAAMPDTSGLQTLPGSSSACLKAITISLTAKGSWEQMLDFFKYLEDMNRISNIEALTLSTQAQAQAQDQASSDILSADISANAFFKEKAQSGSMALSSNLASQGSFNQKSLDKLKETIYAPYDAPAVSPSGQRNIFK
ncbi:MAG TPA: type 4a pilus biogenesis protein PilO [Candidatus Saccharimonadales bacterium]|nr:type 4a pilus biogenesis protein PilO [Candidatus Saccharimonadales bacterium]